MEVYNKGMTRWLNFRRRAIQGKTVMRCAFALTCSLAWSAQAQEPHVAEIISAVAGSVAKLKAADSSAVPMAFWDFDGTVIKGDIGYGFRDADGKGYRGMIEASILAGLTPVYRGGGGVSSMDRRL